MLGDWKMFLFLCKGLGCWKNTKVEQLDNLFLEPNLIILIFVISHWLLTWMKAFWRITKTTSSKGKTGLCPRRLSPTHPGRRAGGLACPVHWRLSRLEVSSPPLPWAQAACVYNQPLLATSYPLATREYFASKYVPFLLFLKMDLNQDASEEKKKRWNWIYSQRNPKNTVWGKMQ